MALTAADLVKTDQDHLIHPLQDHTETGDLCAWMRRQGLRHNRARVYRWVVRAVERQRGSRPRCAGGCRSRTNERTGVLFGIRRIIQRAGDQNSPNALRNFAGMQAVFFTCGGAEANESAFKTARFYWKASGQPDKVKVIARGEGYHGVTLQAMSATKMGSYWKMFETRVPGFLHIQTCYPYRFEGAKPGETIGQAAARELEESILREGPGTVAAFIGEPIHGAGGVIYPADDYWPLVREICTRHDVLLIADEIITGFGRTGRWFGMEHWNVKPDILSFAKGVTSGYLPWAG